MAFSLAVQKGRSVSCGIGGLGSRREQEAQADHRNQGAADHS